MKTLTNGKDRLKEFVLIRTGKLLWTSPLLNMIKDRLFRLALIPLLGAAIAFLSGMIAYSRHSTLSLITAEFYFIAVSFCIWNGCQWIHHRLRPSLEQASTPFYKIFVICLSSVAYTVAVAAFACLVWSRISNDTLSRPVITSFILLSVIAVIILTLFYEILYLTKERDLDNKIVDQLDDELTRVELIALRNELDPHFLFNSLNTLSSLIASDQDKANVYNARLAELYKYFIQNNSKDLVTLKEEIDFIEGYISLLKFIQGNRLQFRLYVSEDICNILIIPCSLQTLVENAIKHNDYTEVNPLVITLRLDDDHIIIQNNVQQKQNAAFSTKIGLKNLNAQYLLIAKQQVRIERGREFFVVRLPLLKANVNDINSKIA